MSSGLTLAFDLYGTLFNTNSVDEAVKNYLGDRSGSFASAWREKQIEYSFRRGLMRQYVPFNVCIADALDYVCDKFDVELEEQEKLGLLQQYRQLKFFADVEPALQQLRDEGHGLHVLSNGYPDDLQALLGNSGIKSYFQKIVSVDEIKTFKPDPDVYTHFLRRVGSTSKQTWLVSGNPFDCIGAMATGFNCVSVDRGSERVFDSWGGKPSIRIAGLDALPGELRQHMP